MKFKLRNTVKRHEDREKKYDKSYALSNLTLNTAGLFQDNRIRLRCFADISNVYRASASIEITEEGPYLASITGDASPHHRRKYIFFVKKQLISILIKYHNSKGAWKCQFYKYTVISNVDLLYWLFFFFLFKPLIWWKRFFLFILLFPLLSPFQ